MDVKDLDNHLISIVIGLRFRQHFSIQDKLGEILDTILYADDSYFNPKIFPYIQEGLGQKRLVSDDDAKNSLLIGHTDIILDMRTDEKEKLKSKIGDIHTHFERQLLKGVIETYKIDQINRMGYVKRYIISDENLSKNFIEKTMGAAVPNLGEVKLSFTKKIPLERAIFEKKYDDYTNVIYHVVKKQNDQRLFLSIDYQHIFDPPADSLHDLKYSEFIKQMTEYNSTKVLQWINDYGK